MRANDCVLQEVQTSPHAPHLHEERTSFNSQNVAFKHSFPPPATLSLFGEQEGERAGVAQLASVFFYVYMYFYIDSHRTLISRHFKWGWWE